MHLGGAHKEDKLPCLQIFNKGLVEPLLWCSHEEADDKVLVHLSHAVKVTFHFTLIV